MVKPSPAILRAAARMAGLSLSFTEMKTLPDCGSVTPAASCDLAKAVAKLRSMPMTSPVDFISGDKTGSVPGKRAKGKTASRSEEHTSELQSLMRISYAVFCLKNKKYTRHV